MNRLLRCGGLLFAGVLLPGCLGEPSVEDRWTKLEILQATPADPAAWAAGGPVTVRARITYRELLTGFLVADLRESPTLTPADTGFEDGDDHLGMARDVDLVLASSTTLAHDARPVTGFDHLIQEVTLSFDAPAASGTGTLFLVLYFSENVEEVELPDGAEIEIVTPLLSTERDILSAGIELSES
jgi:hypothetical protein